jgi:hypothetical protein
LRSCPFRVWHAVGIGDQGRRSGGLWGCPCCAHPARRAASGSPAGSVRSGCGVSSMSLGGGGCAPPSVSETLNPVVHGLHLSPSPLPPPRCRPRICAARCRPRIPIPPKKTKKKETWVGHGDHGSPGHRVTVPHPGFLAQVHRREHACEHYLEHTRTHTHTHTPVNFSHVICV